MTDFAKTLGYGGSAEIDGVQVLITSGSMEEASSPSYLNMLDIPPSETKRSRVLHADGTKAYTASLGFDLTVNAMALFTVDKLFQRRYQFNIGIDDGENQYVMTDCFVNSLSLSGAPGGLLSATLGVSAISGKAANSVLNDYVLDYVDTPDDQPLGYWWSGNTDVRDWTFDFSQDVTPVYINEDSTDPKYLKVGLVLYTLRVNTYTEQQHATINITSSSFTLTGNTTSEGYAYGGITELGTYSHTFETAAEAADGSSGVVIT